MPHASVRGRGTERPGSEVEALRSEISRLRLVVSGEGGRLEAALEWSPHAIVVCDAQGRVTWSNRAAEELGAGGTADPAAGHGISGHAFFPGGPHGPGDSVARCLRDRVPVEAEELHVERLDGTPCVLLGGSAPIFDAQGGFQGVVAVFADVTRLEQEQERLQARERSHRERARRLEGVTAALLQALTPEQVAAAAVEQGGKELEAAEGGLWLLTQGAASLILAHASGAPPLDRPEAGCLPLGEAAAAPFARAMQSDAPVIVQSHGPLGPGFADPGGPGRAIAYLPLAARGGSLGVLAFAFEGSRSFEEGERNFLRVLAHHCGQALERANLHEAERGAHADAEAERARASFLMEANVLLSSSLDFEATLASLARLAVPRVADGCAVYLSESLLARGLPVATAHVDPAKAAVAAELSRRYPCDPAARTGPAQVIRSGRAELYAEIPDELLASTARDGEQLRMLRQLELRSAILVPMSARNRTLGALVLASSHAGRRYGPTDLLMAEELGRRAGQAVDNARLYQEAQRAIQSRDEVLAIVSHDLKNPLSAVLMSSVLLERSPMEGVKRHARMVRRSAERMDRLIHYLLDLSSMEAGHFRLERRPHSVAGLLAETLALLQPVAASRAIELETRVEGALEALCDRDRVFQVLSNLVGNALAFTPARGRVSLSADGSGGEVRITVCDTGPGIPESDRPHIFDRYWSSKRSQGGVGLGLAIAKGIVEAHGGRIWFQPAGGGGSSFAFTLPRA